MKTLPDNNVDWSDKKGNPLGIFPKGAKIYTDSPNENGLFDSVDGFIQGNIETAADVIKYFNNSLEKETYRRGELRDSALSPWLANILTDRNISNEEKSSNNKNFSSGFSFGELTDIPTNLALAKIPALAGKMWALDDAGKIILREEGIQDMYHLTVDDFKNFTNDKIPNYDLGTHFGNRNQATNRGVSSLDGLMESGTNIHRNYLDDLDMKTAYMDDLGMWRSDQIMKEIKKGGILSHDEIVNLQKKLDSLGFDPDSKSHQVIRNALKRAGYSTIEYPNTAEGTGMSFIALDPERQILPATEKPYLGALDQYSGKRTGAYGVRQEVPHRLNEYLEAQGGNILDHIPKKELPPQTPAMKKKQQALLQKVFADLLEK